MSNPGDTVIVMNSDQESHWSEEDILRLHGLLLEKSLHDLFDSRASVITRVEILEWIKLPRDGANAFSYWICCRLFGFDPEEIRDRVLKRYSQSSTH